MFFHWTQIGDAVQWERQLREFECKWCVCIHDTHAEWAMQIQDYVRHSMHWLQGQLLEGRTSQLWFRCDLWFLSLIDALGVQYGLQSIIIELAGWAHLCAAQLVIRRHYYFDLAFCCINLVHFETCGSFTPFFPIRVRLRLLSPIRTPWPLASTLSTSISTFLHRRLPPLPSASFLLPLLDARATTWTSMRLPPCL